MWIFIRLLITAATFALHFVLRLVRDKPEGELAGRPFYKTIRRNKQKRITGFSIGVALPAPIVFRLQAETASDRFFKKLGLAEEFQTGDSDFDQRVYIASDHPALHRVLIENERLRLLVRQALDMGFRRVAGDGTVLWLERSAARPPAAAELDLLTGLAAAMEGLGSRAEGFFDPFTTKVAVVEAVVWSIFAYGFAGAIALIGKLSWEYFDKMRLFTLGLLTACGLFAVLFAAIVLWLRGSSRGHRIVIESAVVLVLGLPLAGTQLVSDLNQYVGTPERTVITREITGTRHETRRRKRRTKHYYYLDFVQVAESPYAVPRSLRVEQELYDTAAAGRTAQLHLANGWLGIPWIEKVEVR